MSKGSRSWVLDVVACPQDGCGGRLREHDRALLRCARCKIIYPVLAGVPILVPAPAHWMAAHREAVLATLVEHDAVDRATVAVVDAFASAVRDAEAQRFGDDWVRDPAVFALPGLEQLETVEDVIDHLAGAEPGVVLDLGCGDGAITERVGARARRVAIADLSLRAVLRARRRLAGALGVVVDAEHLALHPASVDTVIAANLVDLLDRPHGLLAAVRGALRKGGRLILSTPEPGLGDPDDDPDVLIAALATADLVPAVIRDLVPWPRVHRRRHAQLDACWVCIAVATPAVSPGASPRRPGKRAAPRPAR